MVPAVALEGLKDVIAGAPLATGFTTKVIALDVPPGSGFTTVTCTDESGIATSAAIIETSSWPVAELNVVGRIVPSQKPTEVLMNPVPLMKTVKSALPAVMLSGEIVLMTGVGGVLDTPLLEQLLITNAVETRRATAVHRERVKQFLLKYSRESRGRSGSAAGNARKTEAPLKFARQREPLN
jgi:hypothetical protein